MKRRLLLVTVLAVSVGTLPAAAQSGAGAWAATVGNDYRVVPDITYLTADNSEVKLDVYVPTNRPGPHPTILHLHGGGWVRGTRESVALRLLPYLEMGFAVVNATYRLGPVSLAPAAVEDGRCALGWIAQRAKEYDFDTARLVVTGYSAGGHLALTTGMLTAEAGFDRLCPDAQIPTVTAIINWYGVTDVGELLAGPNMRTFAVAWLGGQRDREEIARRTSPLTYVRKGIPPVLTIHGDADPSVPYSQATRLHAALTQAGATSELVTIPGGKHGGFPAPEQLRAYEAVRAFLVKHGVPPRPPAGAPPSAASR